jgi:hypothetical protein
MPVFAGRWPVVCSDSADAQRMDADNGKDERTWHSLA